MAGNTCFQCFRQLSYGLGDKIFRHDECPHCSASLRVCKMCEYYDPHSYNECREPIAERVVDKEKANFCDSFRLNHSKSKKEDKKNLLSEAEKLFKR